MAAAQRDRQFKVLKFVGKGSYGSVFLVQRLADGQTYALKEMDVRSMSQAEREDSANEIRLLASVSHPNVISYNEAFLDGNRLCIIMEYAADGDLAKIIKKQQMMKRPLPEDVIWRYLIQVVMGLQALHGMKILHRDIKPGNIMVFENGVVKIGDLGIAKLLTKTAAAKTQIGTPHYMGPEIWKNRPYSYTSDTWAVGCLLYELTALAVPFEARSMSELRYKVLRGAYPPIPNTFSRDLQQLIRECLDPNPDKRPSMDAILASPAVVSRLKLVPHAVRNPPPTAGSALVDTIKVPRGNIAAIKNKLPPAQYATDMLVNPPGHGGHGGQMATIEEGSEEDLPPSRPGPGPAPGQGRQGGGGGQPPPPPRPPLPQQLPPMPKPSYAPPPPPMQLQMQMPKPNYPPPPPLPQPPAAPMRLPALAAAAAAAAPASEAGGGGGYGNRGAGLRPPPSYLPSAAAGTPASQGGASVWSYGGVAGQQGKVSESHANYGAFYHHPGVFTPQQLPSPWQAAGGNRWSPPAALHQQQQQQQQQMQQQALQQQQQAVVQYQSPYISPYGQQRNYGPGPGGGGGALPHLPQLNNGGGAAARPLPVNKMPPWNYGAQAPRRNVRGQPVGARPSGGYYGNGGGAEAQGLEVPRYPPPQWAPRPARW